MSYRKQKSQRLSHKEKLFKPSCLPPIPEKLYFRIGEVSELCHLPPHVLRYWEQAFPQLLPLKRRGNRRYYQVKDLLLIRQIRQLLYEEGYTIEGARQKLDISYPLTWPKSVKSSILPTVIQSLEQLAFELESFV